MNHPYYIVPAVEEYKKLDPNSDRARQLARIISANVGDYAAIRLILGIDPPEFAHFYPDMETHTPSTLDTIDSFLDKFGKNISTGGYIPGEEEIPIQEEIQVEEEIPAKEEIPAEEEQPSEEETIGKLLKEKRYQDAIMLIEHQNLNNPQKSIYFAHQIRFLKKLMAIENFRNLTNG